MSVKTKNGIIGAISGVVGGILGINLGGYIIRVTETNLRFLEFVIVAIIAGLVGYLVSKVLQKIL